MRSCWQMICTFALMKILQVTSKWPYPKKDGGAWASLGMAQCLKARGIPVAVFSLETLSHPVSETQHNELEDLQIYFHLTRLKISAKPSWWGGVLNLLSDQAYHVSRFDDTRIDDALTTLMDLEGFDMILIEHLYILKAVLRVAELYPAAKIVYRAHNLEHRIWQRYSDIAPRIKNWYYKLQAKRILIFEKEIWNSVDAIWALSKVDADQIRESADLTKIEYIPVPMPVSKPSETSKSEDSKIIGFIGALDWRPNRQGLYKWIKEIWPLLTQAPRFSCVSQGVN